MHQFVVSNEELRLILSSLNSAALKASGRDLELLDDLIYAFRNSLDEGASNG